ncbi:amidohydrolase [Niabella terrae]
MVAFMSSCSFKKPADLIVYNATIYTVDSEFRVVDAMTIADGKILATGSKDSLLEAYDCKDSLNAEGKFIYPGLIDAHAHFVNYAKGLTELDLTGTESWSAIMEKLAAFKLLPAAPGSWVIGRGWDQNDWPQKHFPDNEALNELFPDRPVYLVRIDGHAAIANDRALAIAGIRPTDTISGGAYLTRNEKLTGVLIDNAMDKVAARIPALSDEVLKTALLHAQERCFAQGLTSLQDCGLNYQTVNQLRSLQDSGALKIRLYVMLSDAPPNYAFLAKQGIIKTASMHVRGFKLFADGALGSRGACLLEDYTDQRGWKGFLLNKAAHLDSVAGLIASHQWQMCTHAIGDSANRLLLKIYGRHLPPGNDLRWRIEHAQVVQAGDFDAFKQYGIVPSVQPTHASSDMYWAGDRLGAERLKGAYAYQQLLQQNGWIPLGTDFPVEDISPFKTFYAAVVRRDASGFPEAGFQMENALSREQALRGMTIWAAKAAFEEAEKGSLEPGKFADFIVLDRDLMQAPESELLAAKTLRTYLGGQQVYAAP